MMDSSQAFRTDPVAAGISGVWSAQNIEAAWGANYGAVKLPTYTCAGQQVQMASFSGYKMVGVNAYSKRAGLGIKSLQTGLQTNRIRNCVLRKDSRDRQI